MGGTNKTIYLMLGLHLLVQPPADTYSYVDDGAKEERNNLHLLVKPPAVSPSVEPPRNGENALLSKILFN